MNNYSVFPKSYTSLASSFPKHDRDQRIRKGRNDGEIRLMERGRWFLLAIPLLLPVGGCSESAVVASASSNKIAHSREATETTFDDIKFDMELNDSFQRSMLTDKIEGLFGQRIRIRGYMYPTLKRRGLKGFVLVRDNQECCFGPGAALFDCIRVQMQPDKTAEYSIRPVTVEGEFQFEEFADLDGTIRAIYLLQQASVE